MSSLPTLKWDEIYLLADDVRNFVISGFDVSSEPLRDSNMNYKSEYKLT